MIVHVHYKIMTFETFTKLTLDAEKIVGVVQSSIFAGHYIVLCEKFIKVHH
jgi:hypothetical protein